MSEHVVTGTGDLEITVSTDEGPVRVSITRQALSRLSGRSHVTPEEVASAYRIEIEDIVRRKVQFGAPSGILRLTEADFAI
ncbi:hypothetical protein [Sphingomonas oryzagri]